MRLDRFICKSTELTKLEAVQRITAGDVVVNGIASGTDIGESTQVHENNIITLYGQRLQPRAFRYILMHKLAGTLCSNTDGDHPSLFNQLDIDNISELHIAGRLDVDTTGMVLITDDGRWTYNITVPAKRCQKVYRVGLSRGIAEDTADELIARFKRGIQLQGEQQLTLPSTLKIIGDKTVLLTITEGKYHQVKRMFAAVGNRVLSLHREKIGTVSLDVGEGQWRNLSQSEVASFTE